MATWRSDLNRVLLIFNVRAAAFVRQSLTALFQTELAVNTHGVASDTYAVASDTYAMASNTHVLASNTHVVVSDTHVVASDTHGVASDTRAMVLDIHRSVVTGQGATDSQQHSVGTILQ